MLPEYYGANLHLYRFEQWVPLSFISFYVSTHSVLDGCGDELLLQAKVQNEDNDRETETSMHPFRKYDIRADVRWKSATKERKMTQSVWQKEDTEIYFLENQNTNINVPIIAK